MPGPETAADMANSRPVRVEDSFLPVPGQMDDEGDVDEPTRSVVGESDTESLNGGASSASATGHGVRGCRREQS